MLSVTERVLPNWEAEHPAHCRLHVQRGRLHTERYEPGIRFEPASAHQRALQDGKKSWWAIGYKARWMRSASSSSAIAAAGSLPICLPIRSTATDRTCSACALESCLSPV
jgi:hypothetical protein